MINPLDIQKKEFKNSMLGYDKNEVKTFMSEVASTLEKCLTEIQDLKKKNAELDSEVKKYKQVEETMTETLLVAKQTADELVASAKKKELVLIKEAELKIDEKVRKSELTVMNLERKIDQLKLKYESEKIRLSGFLKAQLALLEDDIPTIENIKDSKIEVPNPNKRAEVIPDPNEKYGNEKYGGEEQVKPKDALILKEDTHLDYEEQDDLFEDLPSLQSIRQNLESIRENLDI
ncbi:MAG: DivIVA domain-containing protein [Bacillota bacterium]|nr:DivIVA domain-containing protein [Bacillota bacterium]